MMAQTLSVASIADHKDKVTYRLMREYGQLFVDEWRPRKPSGAPPVLLIHGWGGTGTYWKQTARALSETVRVIVPDLPGTGRSQPTKPARDMYDQVDTLIDLLDYFDLDRVQVVGHSMGGAMAVLLADQCANRIDRIVLASLTFFKTEQQKAVYRKVMSGFRIALRMRAGWMASIPGGTHMMAQHYFHRVPKGNPLLKRGLLDFLELDAATATRCADDAADDTIPQAGARLHMPVMLIAPRQDAMMPMENVDFTADVIPNCEVRWIEECGHIPMIEKTDEFLSILSGFLHL